MNDDARSAPLLETLLGTVLTRLPLRVLNLAIDQLPDGVISDNYFCRPTTTTFAGRTSC